MQNPTNKIGQFNPLQLNIVTTVDVHRANRNRSLDGCIRMVDNSPGSSNQGTSNLKTVCKQGQVINWLVYPLDGDRRYDGSFPPFTKILSLVFLTGSGHRVAPEKVCRDFKIFGGPDYIRSAHTPAFYYWAGMVIPDLTPGEYKYQFVMEVDSPWGTFGPMNLNGDVTPSLSVQPMKSQRNDGES